ncbi:hypothetical protein SAMN04489752_1480 [Brevibacterium siliguriense]|uniref:Uncharacterized protein n=1 Tax=Brevibacterium siliguriense TaxID=1136497 RepID=A0A1H1RC19_9MICO|nr:hypothetical protein SAMN04489752_1480 [Brevibacterium siliguriense]
MSDRQHEISWGVRVNKPPHDMTREELEDALYSVADYASRRLSECVALKDIISKSITKKED